MDSVIQQVPVVVYERMVDGLSMSLLLIFASLCFTFSVSESVPHHEKYDHG